MGRSQGDGSWPATSIFNRKTNERDHFKTKDTLGVGWFYLAGLCQPKSVQQGPGVHIIIFLLNTQHNRSPEKVWQTTSVRSLVVKLLCKYADTSLRSTRPLFVSPTTQKIRIGMQIGGREWRKLCGTIVQ